MLLGIEKPKSIRPTSLLKVLLRFFIFCPLTIGTKMNVLVLHLRDLPLLG